MDETMIVRTILGVTAVILSAWLICNVFGTIMVSRNLSSSKKELREVRVRAALMGVIINKLIENNGIERTLEDLEKCGYQVCPDETSPTHYTLVDPMGYNIELDFVYE